MPIVRWRIDTRDRVGMLLDVVAIISRLEADIRRMEVGPGQVFVVLETLGRDEALTRELVAHPDIRAVTAIDALPGERQEREMGAVLASVSEGLIAADRTGVVTLLNPAGEAILQMSAAEVVGRPLVDVFPPDIPMLRALASGEPYDNEEIVLNSPRGRVHYLTTGRPIADERGRVTGVVAALKAMDDARQLAHSLTRAPGVSFGEIVYRSEAMARALDLARAVAPGDVTVLILGESGTGKELFARAIHAASRRSGGPFVPINCAAIPESLLETELFGYEEGAFTGARRGGRQGLFEYADGGTLFLDEIGEMPGHLQAKLLRVLEAGRVRRVGGRREVAVDVRILAATNRDLERMVEQQAFRRDLYYRLNVIPIFIPPLRDRPDDIVPLARHALSRLAARLRRRTPQLAASAERRLLRYAWPGNVRELENVMERAMHLTSGERIEAEHLLLGDAPPTAQERGGAAPTERESDESRAEETAGGLGLRGAAFEGGLAEQVGRFEADLIARALSESDSVREAARKLQVSHTQVLNKMRRYGLRKRR